jgi:uncharacterized protein YkwD
MLALLVATTAVAQEKKKAPTYHPTFVAMVKHANAQRAMYGKPALTIDPGLMAWSASHTRWMCRSGLQHSEGVAEIIARGQTGVREVIQDWMTSDGHRANLLGDYRYVGAAGYVYRGQYYWCMQFSSQRYSVLKDLTRVIKKYQQPSRPTTYSPPVSYNSGGS